MVYAKEKTAVVYQTKLSFSTLLNCAIKLNRITVSGTQPSNKSYAMTTDFYKPALRQQGSDQHTVVILRE